MTTSVLMGFPVYERPCAEHMASAMDTVALCAHMGITVGHAFAVGMPIHQARNKLVEAFLASDFEHLFMIDCDMSWEAEDFVRLLTSDHQVVAGVGRRRNDVPDADPRAWCFQPIDPTNIPMDANGFMEVAMVGTGFICFHRSVFEELQEDHPEWLRRKSNGQFYPAFFRWEHDGQDELSEDVQFCRDWRALGGRIMIDPKVELGHYGPRDFRGRLSALFK